MPQAIVRDGGEVQVVSYDDLYGYFRKVKANSPMQDTDQGWWTLVTATKKVTAIHRGCQQDYGVCQCASQLVPLTSQLVYHLAVSGIGRTKGEKRVELRSLLGEWVIPLSQLGTITRHDITTQYHSFRLKVFDAVQALVETTQA